MKILVLNYEFPPVGGGGGKITQDICRVLAARGHEIHVATSWFKNLPRHERLDGYDIFRYQALRSRMDRGPAHELAGYVLVQIVPVLKHAYHWKPDLIHCHFAVPTGIVGWLVSNLLRIPYVLTAHLGDVPGGVPEKTAHIFRHLKPFTVPIWTQAAAITGVSEFTQQLVNNAYGLNIQVIHNGVDLSGCKPEQVEPYQPPRLFFAARLQSQKQPLFVLDVLERVKDLPWRMNLAGDGPLMENVRSRWEALELQERVQLMGWIDSCEVDRHLQLTDVLLMPSLSEGLPIVGIRALAYGVAILGSDIPGLNTLVDEGVNGYKPLPGDLDGFEQALRKMLTQPQLLRNMKRESRRISERFELGKFVDQYEAVYQKVLAARC